MRKEVVWAIIAGLLFGLVIMFGIVRVNKTLKPHGASTQNKETPAPIPTSEFKIVLNKPENYDVITDSSTNINGITKALTWILISGEKGDYLVQAKENGSFDQTITLIPGVNKIKVTAFGNEGSQSIQKLIVIYSSSFKVTTKDDTSKDSTSESSIRDNVQKRVVETLNKPKAYIGSVTDITDTTLQLKADNGTIEQVSVDIQALSVNKEVAKQSNREIKFSDIAIGDYIVAMGYKNSNSVLSATRILVTDPISDDKINAYLGTVTETSKSALNVQRVKDQTVDKVTGTKASIYLFKDGDTTTTKFSGIQKDTMIIYVLDESGDLPQTRSIFVISQG